MTTPEAEKLPVLGASTSIKNLERKTDWFRSGNRDIELTDPILTAIFDDDFEHLRPFEREDSLWSLADWKTLAQRANDLLAGFEGRIGIHGPFIDTPSFAFDRRIAEVTRLRLNQALEFASEIGATQMVLHSPWEFFGGSHVPHSGKDGRSMIVALGHMLLDEVVLHAAEANCTLVFETVYDKRTGPLIEFVRSFDSPYVRMSIDFGHTFINQQSGGPPPDQWVRDAGELLAHTHIQDNDGLDDRHWPAGRGSINWYAVFAALNELETMPRLILEAGDWEWVVNHFRDQQFAC